MRHDPDDRPDPPTRRIYHGCKDRMCGAEDCPTCRPGTYDHPQNSDEREEQEFFEKHGKITTTKEFPPIPMRCFDWLATLEDLNEDSPQGWGETEAEAIADLKQQIEDNQE